jgi:deoxyhypusine synthase
MITTLSSKDKEKVLAKQENEKEVEENILKKSEEVDSLSIKGYNFNSGVNYSKLIDSYLTTGFQATNLGKAIEIVKKMRREKAFVYLGYTSNMISSGLREIICYLAQHKLVDIIVTTAGGIEEDFVKCLGDFKIGDFRADGAKLREKGINRIGNIFVPNSRYCKFEEFVLPVLEKYKDKTLTPGELIHTLGKEINNEKSIYYWCFKNNIPVFCPAIMDGSLGDMIYFFKNKNSKFKLEITEDTVALNNSTIGKTKTGMIILGGGVIKHSICNANLYRNGADFAVYINSNPEFDGSDSGASIEEAKSWGKVKGKAENVKVFGDATLIFPLLVAKGFID